MKWRNPQLGQLGVSFGSVAEVALQIAADPALTPFVERLKTLHELEVEAAANEPPTTPGPPTVGIGLQNFLLPLDMYIFMKRRPWVFYGIIGGVVFGIGAIGYKMGRKRRGAVAA